MTSKRLTKYLEELARIERYPLLRRFHHRAGEHHLWTATRDTVARGVAIGFFFGILTPVAQILFAILVAILLRANVLVAAASTLITNPLILPFVYYYAYQVGAFLTGRGQTAPASIVASELAAERALDVPGWAPTLLNWVNSIGLPLLVGVLTVAAGTALAGYLLIHASWGLIARLRRRPESPPQDPA